MSPPDPEGHREFFPSKMSRGVTFVPRWVSFGVSVGSSLAPRARACKSCLKNSLRTPQWRLSCRSASTPRTYRSWILIGGTPSGNLSKSGLRPVSISVACPSRADGAGKSRVASCRPQNQRKQSSGYCWTGSKGLRPGCNPRGQIASTSDVNPSSYESACSRENLIPSRGGPAGLESPACRRDHNIAAPRRR